MRPTKLLVFDLETVPDVALARAVNADWRELDDMSVRSKLSAQALEKTQGKSDFLPPAYHRIVAIGCLSAEIEHIGAGREAYHYKKFGCITGDGSADAASDAGECALLEKFLEYGGRDRTLLVSFNGVRFDMSVIRLRALKHELTCKWLLQQPDKWKNYFKNAAEFHEDLSELIGSGGPLKMNEAAKLAGLPGKLDIDGSWVADLASAGDFQQVRDYCETDILNTYLLYIRYQHLIGVLDTVALQNEERRLRDALQAEREQKTHYGEFVDAWPTAKRLSQF